MSIDFIWRILQRRSVISRTLLIRDENSYKSRSRMYRISISSLIEIKLCRAFRSSILKTQFFIRSRRMVWETSYVFTVHRIDISWFVRITWMTKRILTSWDWKFIVLLCCDCVRWLKDCNVKEKCTRRLYVRDNYESR